LASWGFALFEYIFRKFPQTAAARTFFSVTPLKIIQETRALTVFAYVHVGETSKLNSVVSYVSARRRGLFWVA